MSKRRVTRRCRRRPAVGDHRIRFGARQGRTAFGLDRQGRIALRYANGMAPFQYTFQA